MHLPPDHPCPLSSVSLFLLADRHSWSRRWQKVCSAGSGTGRMSLLLRSGLLSLPRCSFQPASCCSPGPPLSVVVLRCHAAALPLRCCETVKGRPRISAVLDPRRQSCSAEVGGGRGNPPALSALNTEGVHCSRDVTGCYTPSGSSNQWTEGGGGSACRSKRYRGSDSTEIIHIT